MPVFSPKIVVIGDSGVGKTALVQRYCRGVFHNYPSSIGVGQLQKDTRIDGVPIRLNIWDTAGQERFRTITHSFYRYAHCVIVVYDITACDSLIGLNAWFDDVKAYAPEDVVMCLVGTKKDMGTEREVTEEQARELAVDHPKVIDVIETSAKDNVDVDKVFETLVRELRYRGRRRTEPFSPNPSSPSGENLKKICFFQCCNM